MFGSQTISSDRSTELIAHENGFADMLHRFEWLQGLFEAHLIYCTQKTKVRIEIETSTLLKILLIQESNLELFVQVLSQHFDHTLSSISYYEFESNRHNNISIIICPSNFVIVQTESFVFSISNVGQIRAMNIIYFNMNSITSRFIKKCGIWSLKIFIMLPRFRLITICMQYVLLVGVYWKNVRFIYMFMNRCHGDGFICAVGRNFECILKRWYVRTSLNLE